MVDVTKTAQQLQDVIEERGRHIGMGRYGRVLKMARKPTAKEYAKVLQVTGLGILALGFLGFFIYIVMHYGPDWIAPLLR